MSYTYEQVAAAGVGYVVRDAIERQAAEEQRHTLAKQTHAMALRLEAAGVQAFAAEADTIWSVDDLTGEAEQIGGQRYRHIQLLPSVAKRDRNQMVRAMTYWMENHPAARFFRYAVITSGQRVPYFDDLKARRRELHANIRRWASEIFQRYGIILLFRGDEYTFRDAGVHFHCNVVYWPTRSLKNGEWQEFLSFSRQRLGGVHWKDNGKLEDVREVVKYVCKLGSDESKDGSYGVDRLSSDQLAWFHGQVFGARQCQARGPFAAFMAELDRDNLKVVWRRFREGSRLVLLSRTRQAPAPKKERTGELAENVVIGRTLPCPNADGVSSTRTLVLNLTHEPATGCGQRGLSIIENNSQQARQWALWNGSGYGAGPGAYIVHNGTPNVQVADGVSEPISTPARMDGCRNGKPSSSDGAPRHQTPRTMMINRYRQMYSRQHRGVEQPRAENRYRRKVRIIRSPDVGQPSG